MKKQFFPAVLLLALFIASCKKEDSEEIPEIGSYADNEALIETGATLYFICDVEGLSGITKINYQNTNITNRVGSSWGNFICDPGYDGFLSSCYQINQTNNTQSDYYLDFHFMGKCPDCKWEDVVKTGDLKLAASDKIYMGVAIWFMTPDQKWYYSDWYTPASEQVNDEIKVVSLEQNTKAFPSHYAKVHFSCTLKSADGKTIRLKNAVARVYTDDMII